MPVWCGGLALSLFFPGPCAGTYIFRSPLRVDFFPKLAFHGFLVSGLADLRVFFFTRRPPGYALLRRHFRLG